MLLRIGPQRSPTWRTLQLPDSDYFRCFPFPWNLYSCLFCSPSHYLTGKFNQQLLATQSEDWPQLHRLLELPWLFFIPLLLQIVHPGLFFTLPSPMDFWWSWILISKYLLSVFPGFHFPRLHNISLTASPTPSVVCPIHSHHHCQNAFSWMLIRLSSSLGGSPFTLLRIIKIL